MNEATPEDDREMEEAQEPVDPPHENNYYKRKLAWVCEAIQGAERCGAPEGMHRERKRPNPALLCDIIDKEPSNYEEVVEKKVSKDAMIEEYQQIIKNDIWDVVPRPEGTSIVTSKWIYKIKHVADGSIEKYKARFVARGFSQKEGIDYEETFAPISRYTSIRSVLALAAVMKWMSRLSS